MLDRFAGQTMTVEQVFEENNVDTPYVKRNYKDVLMRMHAEGTVRAARDGGKPIRRNTFPDDVIVTFP